MNSIVLWKRRTRRNNWKNERLCIVVAIHNYIFLFVDYSAVFTDLYGEESSTVTP